MMQFLCSKGCGVAIDVSDEMIEEARSMGQPVDVKHAVCHNEEGAVQHKYRVLVQVFEDDELITQVGGSCEGANFTSVLPEVGRIVSDSWTKALSMAHAVDSDTPERKEA